MTKRCKKHDVNMVATMEGPMCEVCEREGHQWWNDRRNK